MNQNCVFKKLIENYRCFPGISHDVINFEDIENKPLNQVDFIQGKAWLSSFIYTGFSESYTPYRPVFKGHVENQGISGINWLLNHLPVSKVNLTLDNSRLAFLYPYKAPGFNIKLSFQGIPIENYSRYMSLMYSKEDFPAESFLLEDDYFKPFPVLIPKNMETETIVDFRGSLCQFNLEPGEITPELDNTARLNYSLFLKEGLMPLCINASTGDTSIHAEKFKDFRNSRYNVKYGSIIREFKFESQIPLPGFIPDIPHSICGKIGAIREDFKSPAFSSTPNYGLGKAKAISSCCGPILFNYVQGNIIALSVHCNLSDKLQQERQLKAMEEFEVLLKEQLKEYMKNIFKTDITYSDSFSTL